MATNLRGVMAALLTPFDQQQALDKASLRRLVQFNIQQGIDGLYVGGSTGEAFVQSLSEREQVLEIVAEEAKGKIKLIAHVGCVSTAESQQLAASAKRYGFDAVSAVTPFYYPFSFEEPFSIVCAYPILSDARGKHRMFNIKEKYSAGFQCPIDLLEYLFYVFNIMQGQI